jgi:pilus assembly protein CpaC
MRNNWVVRSFFILLIAVAAPGIIWADDTTPSVKLLVGRSAVVDVGTPITRVSLTSSEIADAMVTSSSQLLVNGKMPGTISMFVWERGGALRQYEIVVQRDLARLNDQIKRLFPGESIDAQSNGKSIVLSGVVSSKELSDKASTVAAGYVDKADDVVNLLKLQQGIASNQVLLKVRFAEVSRTALTELGTSLFTSPIGVKNVLARTTTQQFPAPGFDELQWTKANGNFGSDVTSATGKFTFSDFLNLFLFSEKYDIGAMVKALQTRGLFQSLAEPNLVAESGKEASFLAGGEIPIPIAQGTGGNVAISVQFKEFGIRLNFTPVINGDRVHLKVKPEVSTLDFANAVTLQGFRIPALSTRRTETELELSDGQTFAIAGLMNNTMNSTLQKIPGIGDIPILGLLFKSKAAQKDQTELVVMITPHILTRTSPGVTNSLPRTPEPFLPTVPDNRTLNPLPPSFTPGRPALSNPGTNAKDPVTGKKSAATNDAKTPAPSAAGAAAAMQNLNPTAKAPVRVDAPGTPSASAAAPAAADAQTLPSKTLAAQPARPMTSAEKKAFEKAREQDLARKKVEAVQLAREDEARMKAEKAAQEQQARNAKEQEKKDREQAKVAAEEAKRLAEIQKTRQKAIDEAEAKAKEAQAKVDALKGKQ